MICLMTSKGQFNIWLQVKVKLWTGQVMSYINWGVLKRQTHRHLFCVSISIPSKVIDKNICWQMTSVRWAFEGSGIKYWTRIIKNSLSYYGPYQIIRIRWVSMDMRNVSIFSHWLNGEVTKIALPEVTDIQNLRHTYCRHSDPITICESQVSPSFNLAWKV